ncbi:PilZ domain-containing protein [Novosphingobium sp.]|uniref:PilZ domain-containing protein n=1 Tax=Novosphingobium sp. TaxID=1874826 RepID=UPI00286A27A9|nr:PilZ domain-containing protein [Novosphingobium sp.]
MSNYLVATKDPYFSAAQEDRSAPRTRVSIPATLRVSGGRGFQTVIHDLSLSGFCGAAINRLQPGAICWLTLPGMEALQSEVIWWDNSLVGCAFDKLLSPIVHDNVLARYQTSPSFRNIC